MSRTAPGSTTVARDLMTPEVLRVREDMTIPELAAFLRDHEITGAPVETEGKVVGVVSLVDLAKADSERPDTPWDPVMSDFYRRDWDPKMDQGIQLFRPGKGQIRVRDIMQTRLHSVGEDAGVPEIARKMLTHHIHRVLVIEDGKLVGVISTSDLLGLLLEDD